jgi:hypothetical protein
LKKNGRRANQSPEQLAEKELLIGVPPSSAFNGQSDSTIGKALPDLETTTTAGATLNAVGLTRDAENVFPISHRGASKRSASNRV